METEWFVIVVGRATVGAVSLLKETGRDDDEDDGTDVKVISGMVSRSMAKVGKARVAVLFSEWK